MASLTAAAAKHATLTGATGDIVRLSGTFGKVQVLNRSTTEFLYARLSQGEITAAITAETDDSLAIPPYAFVNFDTTNQANVWVSVAGNSNPYSVQGVSE